MQWERYKPAMKRNHHHVCEAGTSAAMGLSHQATRRHECSDCPHELNKEQSDRHEAFKTGWC